MKKFTIFTREIHVYEVEAEDTNTIITFENGDFISIFADHIERESISLEDIEEG